jgi:hypothetical protein
MGYAAVLIQDERYRREKRWLLYGGYIYKFDCITPLLALALIPIS